MLRLSNKKHFLLFAGAISILGLLLFPMLKNEMHLWLFAKQLDKVEHLLSDHYELLADGSDIYVAGNTEYCGFRATRMYSYYANKNEMDAIKNKIENIDFSPPQSSNPGYEVEKYIYTWGSVIAVSIQAGPYSAGLDIRCW